MNRRARRERRDFFQGRPIRAALFLEDPGRSRTESTDRTGLCGLLRPLRSLHSQTEQPRIVDRDLLVSEPIDSLIGPGAGIAVFYMTVAATAPPVDRRTVESARRWSAPGSELATDRSASELSAP